MIEFILHKLILEMLSIQERIEIVKLYYENNKSRKETLRKFMTEHRLKLPPFTVQTITKTIQTFEETGSIHNKLKSGRPSVSSEIVKRIESSNETGKANSATGCHSAHQIAKETGIPYSTVLKVLKTKLKLRPYHLHMVQELKNEDYQSRVQFANWFISHVDNLSLWQRILWTDEAHFYLNGAVSTKHCIIWADTNPHAIKTKALHPQKVTVWAAFTSDFLLKPAFIDSPQTVNQHVYLKILKENLIEKLPNATDYWFMQDGATAHTSNLCLDFLKSHFGENKIISRRCSVPWPPRSPDLNPCDFFLWGYLKHRVFMTNPKTIQELKSSIENEMAQISSELLNRSVLSLYDRLLLVLSENGGHIEN